MSSFQQAGKDFCRRARSFVILDKTQVKFIPNVRIITMGLYCCAPTKKWKNSKSRFSTRPALNVLHVIGGCEEITAVMCEEHTDTRCPMGIGRSFPKSVFAHSLNAQTVQYKSLYHMQYNKQIHKDILQ